jgi:hypothetical protein
MKVLKTKYPISAMKDCWRNGLLDNDEVILSRDLFRVLLDLYGVVIALALTTAIGITISPTGISLSPIGLNWKYLLLFSAFFLTIVPFYHGASVYLLRTYRHGNPSKNRAAPLIDFFILAIEAVILYATATTIKNLLGFETGLALLFLLDLVWVGFTGFITGGDNRTRKWWAILDSSMILFLIIVSGINENTWPQVYLLILAATIIRTFFDYSECYDYYFPITKGNNGEEAKFIAKTRSGG